MRNESQNTTSTSWTSRRPHGGTGRGVGCAHDSRAKRFAGLGMFLVLFSAMASGAEPLPAEPGVGSAPGPSTGPVDVVVYRSGQCGAWKDAIATVRECALELDRKVRIRVVVVRSLAESERLRFHGSPSVVIDGIDVEGPDVEKRPSSFG